MPAPLVAGARERRGRAATDGAGPVGQPKTTAHGVQGSTHNGMPGAQGMQGALGAQGGAVSSEKSEETAPYGVGGRRSGGGGEGDARGGRGRWGAVPWPIAAPGEVEELRGEVLRMEGELEAAAEREASLHATGEDGKRTHACTL